MEKNEEVDIILDEEVEVVESIEPVAEEVVEEVVESGLETFQAQLIQALELNDKLINELTLKEHEMTVFKEVKAGLETVIEKQNDELTQLKEVINNLRTEKFRERINGLAHKWIKKYGLTQEHLPDVNDMLTKFQSEEELNKIENLLGLVSGKDKPSPIALTENSNLLAEKFSENGRPDYRQLSPQEKLDVLHKQLVAYEQLKT